MLTGWYFSVIVQYTFGRFIEMDFSRKLGILVFCGVPAIIGGGIIYAFFGSYTPVFIYEIIILCVAGGFISR